MILKYYFGICTSLLLYLTGPAQNDSAQIEKRNVFSKKTVDLKEITISDSKNKEYSIISEIDKQLRPVNSGQDLLRLVPGLFIAQHAGGGKAEQIFLRGFDCDHGTDFSVNIDGMPVNMVSHAHGQGYADFHFVIPETVDKLKVYKGPYSTQNGDFATSGAGEYSTKNTIDKSMLKLEYGQYETYRAMLMLDVLRGNHLFSQHNENLYVASEYCFSNSFLENKQHLNRYNIFGKYSGQLNSSNFLLFSASTFRSQWDASGQIPGRAVEEGLITRYGSIDPTEGGSTSRTNFNASLTTSLKNGALLKHQVWYSNYHFDLYSNFSFFLKDSVNGDQINQRENGRNIYGYKSTYEKNCSLWNKNLKTSIGIGTRIDEGAIILRHTVKRSPLDTTVYGQLFQQNAFAYIDETLELNSKLKVNAGLRFDYFDFNFQNYRYDSLSGRRQVPKLSPKLNLYYDLSSSVQLYAHAGYGFHSNDARSAVLKGNGKAVPTALGYEVGSTFKLTQRIVVNTAFWGMDMQDQLLYVGDDATVEITGPTRRAGIDLALRVQLNAILFLDADLNYNHGRYASLPKGQNYIPLAPSLTSAGGITVKQNSGLNCSVRYRYINSRPANETNSVTAKGYFLVDGVVNYIFKKFEVGLTVENALNATWDQAQFDTQSRLQGEPEPINELHYTPGNPFCLKGNVNFFF